MENKDRLGKILLVTLVIVLGFVAYKRTDSSPDATVTTEQGVKAEPLFAKEDVEKIVHEYILNNPSIIIESIESMHKKKVDELTAKTTEVLKSKRAEIEQDKHSPSVGEGPVNVTMIYDYSCSYCKKASMVVDKLLAENDNVKVIYKPYPILGDASDYMTKVALSVYKLFPDKFRIIHQAMISRQIASREGVVKILEANNMPVINIESEFENPEIKASLEKLMKLAQSLKIQGVPVFIINDKLYPGLLDLSKLQDIIEPLAPAKKDDEEEKSAPAEATPPQPALKEVEKTTPVAPAPEATAPVVLELPQPVNIPAEEAMGHDEPVASIELEPSAVSEPKPEAVPAKSDLAPGVTASNPAPVAEAAKPAQAPKAPVAPKPKQLLKEAPKPKAPSTPPAYKAAS